MAAFPLIQIAIAVPQLIASLEWKPPSPSLNNCLPLSPSP